MEETNILKYFDRVKFIFIKAIKKAFKKQEENFVSH